MAGSSQTPDRHKPEIPFSRLDGAPHQRVGGESLGGGTKELLGVAHGLSSLSLISFFFPMIFKTGSQKCTWRVDEGTPKSFQMLLYINSSWG